MSENRLEDKIDKIANAQARLNEKVNKLIYMQHSNAADLEEHMRRTAASEKRLAILESYRYYVLGALFMAALLSASLRELLLKVLDVLK